MHYFVFLIYNVFSNDDFVENIPIVHILNGEWSLYESEGLTEPDVTKIPPYYAELHISTSEKILGSIWENHYLPDRSIHSLDDGEILQFGINIKNLLSGEVYRQKNSSDILFDFEVKSLSTGLITNRMKITANHSLQIQVFNNSHIYAYLSQVGVKNIRTFRIFKSIVSAPKSTLGKFPIFICILIIVILIQVAFVCCCRSKASRQRELYRKYEEATGQRLKSVKTN